MSLHIHQLIAMHSLDTLEKKKAFFEADPWHFKMSVDVDKGLYLLKYNQAKSNFVHQACREARGIVLDARTDRVVCRPFDKFFNVGEKHADSIDWNSSVVERKYDGSLIKVYFHRGEWIVATNGTIDARNAPFDDQRTFFDLFQECASNSQFDAARLDPTMTYLFELLHPDNVIVERHDEPALVHLSTRHNESGQESSESIGVPRVQVYPLQTEEQCVAATRQLEGTREGYVVRDAANRRVKIKNPVYVKVHHTTTSKMLTAEEAAAGIILEGEKSELMAYRDCDGKLGEICAEVNRLEQLVDTKADYLAAAWLKLRSDLLSEEAACELTRKAFAKKISRQKQQKQQQQQQQSDKRVQQLFFARLSVEAKLADFGKRDFANDSVELRSWFRARIVECKTSKASRAQCRELLALLACDKKQ